MKLRFRVMGDLLPKKTGELSMWGKPGEARRIAKLRLAALDALSGAPPLQRNIRIRLTVHVGPRNNRSTGDLDNFITGVCDGLMRADPRSSLDPLWAMPKHAGIHPMRALAVMDDSQVMSIEAAKIVDDADGPWYEISLEGDP